MRKLLCALAIVAVMASPVLAGGGSKADATIKVTNNGTAEGAAVIVDPPGGLAYAPASLNQVIADGGKQLAKGANYSFKVKSGAHVVWVILGTQVGEPSGVPDAGSYSVAKGKTLSLVITDGATLTP
ncbi:MAG: hypothetical protein ACYC3X_06820 [Pirellulaceae bacterium]